MNILLAGDAGIANGLELVIYSTMLHNRDVHWHIFTMDVEVDHRNEGFIKGYKAVPQETLDWFNFMIKFMDGGSTLTVYDTREAYDMYLANSVNATTPFTPFTTLRLLADILLDVPNVLYLDGDVIVQDDLGWMYAQYASKDIDYAASCAHDACEGWGEMVAGIMMMNLDHMRRSGMMERARSNYNRFEYRYPDQSAIAHATNGEFVRLPDTYGYLDDHKMAPYKPAILHFTNGNKYKIYTTQEGVFYRFYPEHKYLKDGMDILREVYHNYESCMSPDLKHDYKRLKCGCHTQAELEEAAQKEQSAETDSGCCGCCNH